MKQLKERNWKNLVNDIYDGRCILFLGPLLPTMLVVEDDESEKTNEWKSIRSELTAHLKQELLLEQITFDKKYETELEYIAQKYLTIPRTKEIHLREEVAKFYEQNTKVVPVLYEKLAKIPFKIIINTTPDDYFLRAVEVERKVRPHFAFYDYNENTLLDGLDFSDDRPLIYNLTGSAQKKNSLVLTEAQQVAYIKNIVKGDPPIPTSILERLKPPSKHSDLSYLFLGFDLNRWQFKVLLDGLEMHQNADAISPTHANYEYESRTIEYYENRFNFLFVQEEIEAFIDTLVHKIQSLTKDNGLSRNTSGCNIMISVHKKEVDIAESIVKVCSPRIQNGEINIWHRGNVNFNQKINETITAKINSADIILPLLSIDYLADREILTIEQDLILAKQKDASAMVIPVLISACDWESSSYGKSQILPRNGDPIKSEKWGSEAYALKALLKELNKFIR